MSPADTIDPLVVQALDEIGLDIEKEFPKPLTDTPYEQRSSSRWAAAMHPRTDGLKGPMSSSAHGRHNL